jgi:SAM-dependent methyltransferase
LDKMSQEAKLEAQFWEERYQSGQTGWDIGEPAPPLVDFLNSPEAPKPGKILVPGCGHGHEALYLAEQGFEVVGLDFAPSAIEFCRRQARERGLESRTRFEQHDLFKLPADFKGAFDFAAEHTFFCAIDPALRPQYVQVIHDILKPGGKLLAVFWAHNRPGGPPYGTSAGEIYRLFSPLFEIEQLQPAKRGHPRRAGEELWGVLGRQ